MLKFEFHYPDTEIITHQLLGNHHTLTEVIEAFEQFLLGAGYSFPKGVRLGFEEEDGELENNYEEEDCSISNDGDVTTSEWELREMTQHIASYATPAPGSSSAEMTTHTCNNACCKSTTITAVSVSDRCPHDPSCRGLELGTCGQCAFTKPENCT